MRAATALCLSLSRALALPALALDRTPAPPDARVYVIPPSKGDRVRNPLTVRFGLVGMGVPPAGSRKENTGHHQPLIDVTALPPLDAPIPWDDPHRQFGGGQTEATIELPSGQRGLRLVLGDHNHGPHAPPVLSERITITVD